MHVHDVADDEDQWLQEESDNNDDPDEEEDAEDDGEEEEEEEDDDDVDEEAAVCEEDEEHEEHDDGTVYYAGHHAWPIHHHHPLPHQSVHYQGPDGYLSDDLDMSDDAGAPLDYVVAGMLGPSMDMDSNSSEAGSELSYESESESGSDPQSPLPGNGPAVQPQSPAPIPVAFMSMVPAGPIPPPVPNPPALPLPVEQLAAEPGGQPLAAWFEDTHPVALSNPNPTIIGPSNYGLTDFLHHWARQGRLLHGLARGRCPWPASVNNLAASEVTRIRYADLEGDRCDFQGVDWEAIGVSRAAARGRRHLTYSNYVNIADSDRWTVSATWPNPPPSPSCLRAHPMPQPNIPYVDLRRTENFFRFRCMDIRRNVNLSHFQLRNVLASTSRSRVFYPGIGAIHQFNPASGHGRPVMKLSGAPGSQISALDAGHGFLVAGSFHGEYIIRHLDSPTPDSACHEGVITSNLSGITNHVRVHQARTSSAPLASFASNDKVFRVLDLATETFLSQETFDFPLNCTALSPDGRLRVMVGDSLDVLITTAEPSSGSSGSYGGRPEILHRLPGHRDYGFACDWADDGWTIATAFQDKLVKIWDARWFGGEPVCTLRSEMAGVRSVKFSPVGGGRRVLVAAEEADFVNIIDAATWRAKQTVDVFGELGGVAFADGGRELIVLCCDRTRGGILQLDRCGLGVGVGDDEGESGLWDLELDEEEGDRNGDGEGEEEEAEQRGIGYGGYRYRRRRRGVQTHDWPRSVFTERSRVRESAARRRGREAAAGVDLEPF
ncbi:Vegetative incompatibility protein HET-E-1 [Madurella mycetomatis]|uniref:Vegetative incompatibility protein HET-E-1 n=1 Tax=Madurella mycetomatis TaxID=100816 RepID=A0A175VZV1_9PEZI|nr:Vegetative incompatibility protein HET-E-1 [Madurella mycetomatis]KXX78368.1 Vegetative incompatibility protein HET-E-1 [Madurella mycetomatis]